MTKDWQPAVSTDRGALYLAIAEALATDVSAGRLEPGDRLPAQRDLADTLGVSLGTVTRAYAEAERRGLVRGRGRRGTIVTSGRRDRSPLSSLIETGHLIDLSASHPASTLDPDVGTALRTLSRSPHVGELLAYPPIDGVPRHREAMVAWLSEQGVEASADALVMTAGAQHGILAALAAIARPGDVVATMPLTYPGVKAACDQLGIELIPAPADEEGLLPDGLDHLCRARTVRAIYVNPTLHNPTTAILCDERKRALATVAERHDLLIIEDEIHRPLTTDGGEPLLSMAPDRTFLVTSASKSVAGGLRVGCVVGPRLHRGALVDAVLASVITTSAIAGELLALWIHDGQAARTIAARRKEATARQRRARKLLEPAGGTIRSHPSSTYLWLELPDRWTLVDFVSAARERGVAVAPSATFAVDGAAAPPAVRIALSAPPSRERLVSGVTVLARLLAGAERSGRATL